MALQDPGKTPLWALVSGHPWVMSSPVARAHRSPAQGSRLPCVFSPIFARCTMKTSAVQPHLTGNFPNDHTFAFKFEKTQGYSLKTTRSLIFLGALFIKKERDGGEKGKGLDKQHA